jgi:tetratricopeptide (TPR) repeat protein
LYELSPNELKIIIRTFCRVFPEVISFLAYFNVETSVLGLFGAHLPFKLDLERLETKINQKRLFSILKKVMYDDPLEIMGSYITNSKGLKAFVGRGPINTDDHPLVEFGLPLRYLKERQGIYYESLQEVLKVRKVIGPNELKFSASWPLKDTLERLKRRKVAIDAFMQGQLEERFQEIDKAIKYYQYGYNVEPEYRLNYKVLYNLAVKRLYVGDIETAIEIVSWLMAREDNIELYHLNQRLRGLY